MYPMSEAMQAEYDQFYCDYAKVRDDDQFTAISWDGEQTTFKHNVDGFTIRFDFYELGITTSH